LIEPMSMTGWQANVRTIVRFSAVLGATAALAASPAFAGEIDGMPVEETASLTGAPLMAALAPAEAVADEAAPLEAPAVHRLSARLQCVPYAREESGVELRGNASTWWAQARGMYVRTKTPDSGNVMVMRGYRNPGRGHVAVVRQVLSDRSIIVDHANWLNSGEVTLNVPIVDVSPRNDWSQVRVWHIPTQSWGVRVYNVQGFIEPKPVGSEGGAVSHAAR
jgi:surface antigen